ncbi:MAG: site-specific DNA-methyltransferase [Methanomassiliicoccus sp.]|nr:site-specific DNA-methyltransferase [Methanomassiliicoccus sp.]
MVKSFSLDDQTIFLSSSEDMSMVDTNAVNLIITSPPYWNLKDYGHPNQIGQEDYKSYLARMNKVWSECARVSTNNAILAINIGNRRAEGRYYPIGWDIYCAMPPEWKLIDNIIWYIPNALPQCKWYIEKLFDNKYENVLIFAKNYDYNYTFNKIRVKQKYAEADPRADNKNPKGRCIGNVIRIPAYRPPNIKEIGYYKAGYPEELVFFITSTYSNEGNTVLDPFLGSGTTLKVAKTMKRKGIGFEINDALEPTIRKRILEEWSLPPFENLDIIHSSNNIPGMNGVTRRPDLDKKSGKKAKGQGLDKYI